MGPSWGVQGGPTNQLFGDLLALGAKIAPRDPQERPKSLPRASKTPPRGPWGQIFGRSLIVFKNMFGQCFVDLLSFPGTVAGMAEGNCIYPPPCPCGTNVECSDLLHGPWVLGVLVVIVF